MKNRPQAYGAELLGTFALTLSVLFSISGNSASLTPLVAGLVVGLFVYTVGAISGTHLNPAVTLSMLSVKKIKSTDAAGYIVVQLIGAIGAGVVANQLGVPAVDMRPEDSVAVAFAEASRIACVTSEDENVYWGICVRFWACNNPATNPEPNASPAPVRSIIFLFL